MGIDLLGLLLAFLTAIVASLATIFILTITWSSLGLLALPVAAVAALFILALGAMIHAMFVPKNRS